MDHLINQVNYSGSPANHMLPHAEVKIFALYVVLKLKIIKEKLMSLKKKKKKNHFIIFGTKNYKKANPK